MALLSRPGLIPLQIENDGNVITTQVNKVNFVGAVTGSIGNFNDVTIEIGTVATASYVESASYASNATSASYAATASFVAGGASGFPYTGSAQITGSLGITGSFSQSGSTNVFLQGLINQTTAQSHVVTFNNTTGQLFITASSAFGGGGGGGSTPGGATTTIQYNNAGVLDGSNNFTLVGGNAVNLTGSLLVTGSTRFIGSVTGSSFTGSFTGSLLGSSSYAATSSYAGIFKVQTSLTASGLNYPTVDNGEFSFIQTDGLGNLSLQYVNTLYETIYNGEATSLDKGTPVYVSGALGANSIVYRADAGNSAKMPVIYIAADNIASGTTGRGIALGLITGVDTTGYPPGTEVYVAVGGGWTATRPTGSAIVQVLGIVTKEGSGGQGVVLNPGPANLPNLPSGSVWVGNSGSFPTPVLTSSLSVASASFATSASYALSSSYATQADNTNTININSFSAPVESYLLMSNVVATTGVAIGGDSDLRYNSSTNVLTVPNVNAFTLTGSLSGSLFGTGSWAVSSSFAISSSFASTSSFSPLYLLVSNTGSMLSTYLPTARTGSFATTGSNTFKSNQTITGSINTTGSINLIGPVTQSNGGNNLTTFNEIIYLPSVIASGPAATLISKPIGPPVSMFIEYQIIDVITNTDQRTGYIMANFNSSGTPTSTFTETVTADIGNTTGVVFSTNVGATYDIQATNSGANPYTFKAILRYF